ncbi:MAG TPA: M20/M25/M40 family metallo-hydrolase [Vicinamibacterales bacterium]|jgi:acetylornithine deacetylase/succinyl-diaminopimelate desuccinylase-like protein
MNRLISVVFLVVLVAAPASAQSIDWNQIGKDAAATLQAYIKIDTTNPPSHTDKAADFLEAIYQREGIPVTRYESAPGKSILVARLKGSGAGRPILILNHMDVVPADASHWKVPPFSGQLINGEIWGRGAMDMKGFGTIQLYALIALKRAGVHLTRDIIMVSEPDEETGGQDGARWMIEHHFDELNPEYVLDEGGFGSRDLYSPGKLVFGISVEEKRLIWLKITATGTSGHASQPTADNPNNELVTALARLVSQPLPTGDVGVLETMKQKLGTFAPNKFMNAIQHSTISLTTMTAGVGHPPKVNVIPGEASATLDCRILPDMDPASWIALIKKRLADPKLTVEVLYQGDGSILSPPDSPMFKALASAITTVHPGAIVTPMLVPYTTDSNAYRKRGAKSYGLYPIIASTALINTMHGDNERMPEAQLVPGTRILFEALRRVAGGTSTARN